MPAAVVDMIASLAYKLAIPKKYTHEMFSLVLQLQVSLLQQKTQSTDIKIAVYKALQKLASNYL